MRAIRLLVVGGLFAAGVAIAAPAAHATGTPTNIGFGVDASSPPLSLLSPTVTFSGALWNAQTNAPIPLEPVSITEQVAGTGPTLTVAATTTDTSGNFLVTTDRLTGGGVFTAQFAGDATNGYAASSSSPATVDATGSSTTVVLATAPKSVVPAGSSVTFAGKAYVSGNGKQILVPGAKATLYRNAVATSVTVPVKANGTFSLSVKPTSKANWWVEVDPVAPPWPYALWLYGRSPIRKINAVHVYRSRVHAISVPSQEDIDSAGVSGSVQALAGTAWRPAASVTVGYYFRVLPKGKWRLAGTSKTNRLGAFRWAKAILSFLLGDRFHGQLAWQARIGRQVTGSSEYLASVSPVRSSYVADGTFIGGFNAQYISGSTFIDAVVRDYVDASPFEFPQGTAKFYYLPAGKKTWRYLGSASTDTGGGVGVAVVGRLHGRLRVVFPRQGHFLGSSAKLRLK